MAEEITLMDAQRSAAKVFALAYPISMVLVAAANFGLRGDLIVDGNVAETVRRIAAAQPVFRLSVVFDLMYATGIIVQLTALYVVLSGVGRHLAMLASFLKLMYAVTAVLIALTSLKILGLASSPVYLQGLGSAPLHALVELSSSGGWEQYYVGLVFWALASTLFGWLWLRSRYVPAALALFGVASSVWGLLCAIAYIANPGFSRLVSVWLFDMPMALYYLALSCWLLFKGLRGGTRLT
jgi:hypothetical protein